MTPVRRRWRRMVHLLLTWHHSLDKGARRCQDRRRWRRMVQNSCLGIILGQGRREMPGQEKMEEDGTELLTWHHSWTREEGDAKTGEDGGGWYRTQTWHHSSGQGRKETAKTGEDGGGWYRSSWHHSPGQGRRETPLTGEDGGGWYRTRPGIISWTRESPSFQDRRRWRRMVQNPDLASSLDKGGAMMPGQEKMEEDGTELLTWHHPWTREEGDAKTGEDGGGWYRTLTWHHSLSSYRRRWGGVQYHPPPSSCLGRLPPPKTGEDGGGWYRTQTWHHLLDKGGRRLP